MQGLGSEALLGFPALYGSDHKATAAKAQKADISASQAIVHFMTTTRFCYH